MFVRVSRFWYTSIILCLLCGFILGEEGVTYRIDRIDHTPDLSDMNRDGIVNILDLEIFSFRKLNMNWRDVDWCAWLEENGGTVQFKHYVRLQNFIEQQFECDTTAPPVDPLEILNQNNYPTKSAKGNDGKIYITNFRIGSLFIYSPELEIIGELKNLSSPLGVAVDSFDYIYVGVTGKRSEAGNDLKGLVEIYDPEGNFVSSFGEDLISMPNDIAIDEDRKIYVADGRSNVIWVFDPKGSYLTTIHEGGLKFPNSLEIAYRDDGLGNRFTEIFVGDRGNYLIKVFDLDGQFKRSFGGFPTKQGWFVPVWFWRGKFISIQGMSMDNQDRLHVLDLYFNKVQILNPDTGDFISYYGDLGTDPGLLKKPLDVMILSPFEAIVTNNGNNRLELFEY